MQRQTFLFLLALVIGLTGIAYWPGLRGGFLFDDYGQIVFNPAIEMKDLDLASLIRAAKGSNAGPLGRPISMVSFGLDRYFFRLEPFPYKLDNLLIHLANVALVAWLASLLQCAREQEKGARVGAARAAMLASTAWWALHPLCVTSVLYVVQRMTSLSSLFTLLGLIQYCRHRFRSVAGDRTGVWLALAWLGIGTALSVFCKEIGFLALAYAGVIELFLFRFQSPRISDCWLLKTVFLGGGAACALSLAGYWALHPGWADYAYANREFTLEQRLLTEARIVWFYLRLLFLPSAPIMGLYHDDIPVSTGVLEPPTTVFAVAGHALALLTMVALRKRQPLVAFGIGWFYAGHLLESTFWPLELAYEHRNYLPIFGPILATSQLLFSRGELVSVDYRIKRGLGFVLVVAAGLATLTRTMELGQGIAYALIDAERHPASTRATYDAGSGVVTMLARHPGLVSEYAPEAERLLRRSIDADHTVIPPFMPLIRLDNLRGLPLPLDDFGELKHRLKDAVSPASIHFIARSLLEVLSDSNSQLTPAQGCELYEAALANRKLAGTPRAHVRTAYALYLGNILKRPEESIAQLRLAVKDSPRGVEFRVVLAAMLIDLGRLSEARERLQEASEIDRFGYMEDDIKGLLARTNTGDSSSKQD